MAALSDFEKMRMALIQNIASASTPEKVAALLAKFNSPEAEAAAEETKEKEEDPPALKESEFVVNARKALRKVGPANFFKFGQLLAGSDGENTGTVSVESLEGAFAGVLGSAGDLSDEVFDGLKNEFIDPSGGGGVAHGALYEALLGGALEGSRKNMSDSAFQSFERVGADQKCISLASLLETFSPKNHPDVKAGTVTADQIAVEFWQMFRCTDGEGRVSTDDWERYSRVQSAMHDDDETFQLFLRRVWKMSGNFLLYDYIQTSPSKQPTVRETGKKMIQHRHDELYRGQVSVTTPESVVVKHHGKKAGKHMESHMSGASAMSTADEPKRGKKAHRYDNVSQLEGMTPKKEVEYRRSKKISERSPIDTLSGSGVDPGQLSVKPSLRLIEKQDHFHSDTVGVAHTKDPVRGLKHNDEIHADHFENGIAQDEQPSPRGLKRIVVEGHMENTGVSSAKLETLRERTSKSIVSHDPYYWNEKQSVKNRHSKDEEPKYRGKSIRKGVTPGGNSQIVFG